MRFALQGGPWPQLRWPCAWKTLPPRPRAQIQELEGFLVLPPTKGQGQRRQGPAAALRPVNLACLASPQAPNRSRLASGKVFSPAHGDGERRVCRESCFRLPASLVALWAREGAPGGAGAAGAAPSDSQLLGAHRLVVSSSRLSSQASSHARDGATRSLCKASRRGPRGDLNTLPPLGRGLHGDILTESRSTDLITWTANQGVDDSSIRHDLLDSTQLR